jgi:hypothetical protein
MSTAAIRRRPDRGAPRPGVASAAVRKLGVAVIAVVVGAVAVATVVLPNHDDDKPEALPPPTGEVVEIHPDGLDPAPNVAQDPGEPVMLRPGQPLACMFRLDCLMEQVEDATGSTAPEVALPPVAPPDTVPANLPAAA